MQKRKKACLIFFTFFGIYTVFVTSLVTWHFTPDDAFRYYRLAQNLLDGQGFRWNVSDKVPTETYTTFSWIILLAFLKKISGLALIEISKIIGLFSTIMTLLLLSLYTFRITQKGLLQAAFVTLGFVSVPVVMFHAVSGMETSFFMMLLTVTAILYLESVRDTEFIPPLFLFMLLVILTRPESVLFCGALLFSTFYFRKGNLKSVLLQATVLLVVPGILYLGWKIYYFGTLLPTAYYVKSGTQILSLQGLEYLNSSYLSLFALSATAFLCLYPYASTRNKSSFLILFLAMHLQFLHIITILPSVGYGYRFLYPYLPAFLITIAAIPVSTLCENFLNAQKVKRLMSLVAILVLLIGTHSSDRFVTLRNMRIYASTRVFDPLIGKALSHLTPNPEKVVLCTGEAGAIPFYTGFTHIDIWGLHNMHIAQESLDADYVFENNPDIFITFIPSQTFRTSLNGSYALDHEFMRHFIEKSESSQNTRANTAYASFILMVDPRFQDFELVRSIAIEQSEKEYVFFIRKDFPFYDQAFKKIMSINVKPVIDNVKDSMKPRRYLAALLNPRRGITNSKEAIF